MGNSAVFNSTAPNPKSKDRNAIVSDILRTSIKNLELAQLKALAHKEVEASTFKSEGFASHPSPYEISGRVIRVCMYYETAINSACSIMDIFSDILAKLEPTFRIEKHSRFRDKTEGFQFLEFETEPEIKEFIKDNKDLFLELSHHRDDLLFKISAMIRSVDSNDPVHALPQVFSLSYQVESTIVETCSFIQSFLQFADKFLASKMKTASSAEDLSSAVEVHE